MAIAQDEFRSGSLTAAATDSTGVLELACPGIATVMVQLTGTFTATVLFEVNVDQGSSPTWVAVNAQDVSTGAQVASATATGIYRVDVSGYREFRVHCSAFTSGPIVVSMNGSVATSAPGLASGSGGGAVVDTELPAAVSLGSNISTPTAPFVGAASYGFDGANWDPTNTFPGSSDARSASTITGLNSQSFGYAFNGTTWDRVRGNTAAQYAQGAIAAGSAASGANPTVIAGQNGSGNVTMPHAIASNADGQSATLVGIVGTGFGWDFNGTTWDRHRNRQEVTAYASAARTTAQTGSDIPTYNLNGATIVLDVTAITATPVLTLTIQGKDSLSGKYYDILTGAAVSTVSTNVYKIALGVTVAANVAVSQPLPAIIRVNIAVADADSATYSVGVNLSP
jgi:hypothetical protein